MIARLDVISFPPPFAASIALGIKTVAGIGLIVSAGLSFAGYLLNKKYEQPPPQGFVCFTSSAGMRRTLLNFAGEILIVVGLLLCGICLMILFV